MCSGYDTRGADPPRSRRVPPITEPKGAPNPPPVSGLLLLKHHGRVAGIGGSSIAVAQAYIADITTKENRSKGMGVIGSAFGLGFVFGPLIGGFLSKLGYMETGLASATFSFIAFIVTIILLPESNLDRSKFVETKRKIFNTDAILKAFRHPELAILISLFFILTFSFANIYGTFALLGLQVYGFTDFRMDICSVLLAYPLQLYRVD